MKRYLIVIGCLLALVMVLASFACQAQPTQTMESLRISIAQGPLFVDPILGSTNSKLYTILLYDFLVGQTWDGNDISKETGVAYDWKTSGDNLTWTFSLRKGIQFQEGWGELTAEDVKFSIERVMGPRSRSAFSGSFRTNITSIEVVDPYTVSFKLKAPWATLVYSLSSFMANEGAIVPKKYIDKVGDEEFNRRPIGSGAYKVVEFDPADRIKYTAMDNHWSLGTPRIKDISFHLVPEPGTAIAMLKRGALDITSVPRDSLKELKALGFNMFAKKNAVQVVVLFHDVWKNTPIGNAKVRQAIALAVNKQEILDTMLLGGGQTAATYPAGSYDIGYVKREPYPYDPQRAKQLLAEAGYPNGFELTIYAYPRAELSENVGLAELLSGYLERISIKTKIVRTDYPTFRKLITDGNAAVSVSVLSSANRQFADTTYSAMFSSTGVIPFFKSPELDALIKSLASSATLDEYKERMDKVSRYCYDNYVNAPLLEVDEVYATNPKITDWVLGKGVYDLNMRYLARGR